MNLLIVDDDYLVAQSLKTIVSAGGISVLGLGASGEEAVRLYDAHPPDILLMDIRMGKMSGLEAAERILKKHPGARILFLTTFADDEYIIRALKIGAKGYILKQDFEGIVPALHAVLSGQTVFGENIVAKLPQFIRGGGQRSLSSFGLTEREERLLTLIAEGLSNREIASALYLSEGTVRNAVSVILEKLNLRDRTQLAVFYYKTARG